VVFTHVGKAEGRPEAGRLGDFGSQKWGSWQDNREKGKEGRAGKEPLGELIQARGCAGRA
jgi:hypothetical protein